MWYSWWEYLERVIELSNTASSRTASPGRFIEEYTLYINKISNTVVSTIYALFQDLGLKREVYFTREWTQYHDNPDEARFYGSASIVQSFHIVEEDEVSDLELYVSFQRGEDFWPNSDCGKYMMNLKNQVLAVFALQDS